MINNTVNELERIVKEMQDLVKRNRVKIAALEKDRQHHESK